MGDIAAVLAAAFGSHGYRVPTRPLPYWHMWASARFDKTIRLALESVIATGGVFDFLGHPSCLYVVDPEFRTIELICEMVRKAGDRAALVDLGTIAQRVH